jgi:6-phosphofructokinase 1
MVVGVEDVRGDLAVQEDGQTKLALDRLADRIVDLIVAREAKGKRYGTVVLAQGLAEMLSEKHLRDVPRDEHGHLSLGRMDIGKLAAELAAKRFAERTGKSKKITGVQLGYESRCSPPHAFDVMLGSQLGLGAFYALAEKGLDGHMVSVAGQFQLRYVPFAELIDPKTLRSAVRYIDTASDFHRMAAELGSRL